ncbi:MAG: hypothetical protein JSV95_02730 [Gemmatimonadota bacterium]|nr:MAG: hypothetical protein JSV95_02730 [Gemmatimonadota bacterium]
MRPTRNAGRLAPVLLVLTACDAAVPASYKPAEEQIAEAVLAAPESLRDDAAVLGYSRGGALATLREGSPAGGLICLADDPRSPIFHVACYDRSLEPYMSRGRELAAEGADRGESIRIRQEEARQGKLAMPSHPAALYNLSAPEPPSEPGMPPAGASRLHVVYVPGATAEELGLPAAPAGDVPWLMYSGEPNAHVMILR